MASGQVREQASDGRVPIRRPDARLVAHHMRPPGGPAAQPGPAGPPRLSHSPHLLTARVQFPVGRVTMASKPRQTPQKFSKGDEISMHGTVSIVHDEEY